MRPRFSLKWLLVLIAIAGFGFYTFFVRPTATAKKFIKLVESGDYEGAESLCLSHFSIDLRFHSNDALVEAKLEPRTWLDVLRTQRRVDIRIVKTPPHVLNDDTIRYVGMEIEAIAGLSRIRKLNWTVSDFPPDYIEEALAKKKAQLGQ